MGCMGGLRAVTGKELGRLRALPREARNIDYLDRELVQEDAYDMDKSWDAIHRALTGGKLEYGNTPAPGCWAAGCWPCWGLDCCRCCCPPSFPFP